MQAFSLVAENGGCFLVTVHGLFITVTSLVGEQCLQGASSAAVAHELNSCGSPALEPRLSSCGAWATLL